MKNFQRGFAAPLVIVLLAVIVIGGGAYVYKNTDKNLEDVEAQEQSNSTNQLDNTNNTPATAPTNTQPSTSSNPAAANNKTFTLIPETGVTTQVRIDFSSCQAGQGSVYFALGHTVLKFIGTTNGKCSFQYGTEIENPRWDGAMSHSCLVPVSLGARTYSVGNTGIVMGELESYCSKI